MGLKIIFVDCTKLKCLEAAITPETKVGEREITELTCLMPLNNFIDATARWGVCGKVFVLEGAQEWSLGEEVGAQLQWDHCSAKS